MVDERLITAAASSQDAAAPPQVPPAQAESSKPEVVSGEKKLAELQAELTALKNAFSEYQLKDMPEIDRVKNELQLAAEERDQAANELKELKRKQQLELIAGEHHFNDVEYLDFMLHKNNIDLFQNEKITEFMQTLKKSNPRCFTVPLTPGAGSRPYADAGKISSGRRSDSRLDVLENMLSTAPVIY